MEVKQFYDKALAHGSYAIVSEGQVALVDPARDPQPYLDFAHDHQAKIVAVFETHPHADFISSHREFQEQYGATIYINGDVGVSYPHQPLNDGEEVKIGKVTMRALFTPGHSPDHNSYLLLDEEGQPHSVYTGDSLFVGDVGRPDLREGAGHFKAKRKELAHQMYHTIHKIFKKMDDSVMVYPAHGAGSLCGKNMGPETYSTIGKERHENWAFQISDEEQFVETLLADQPFVPQYFPYDVEMNREGAPAFEESIQSVVRVSEKELPEEAIIVDVRDQQLFKNGHIEGAFNIQEGEKFETWLGALITPEKPFYLVVEDEAQQDRILRRTAKIGYEKQVQGSVIAQNQLEETSAKLDIEHFRQHPEAYTIVDVRNASEAQGSLLFKNAVNIPLAELPERASEVDTDKPVVVHCAGGYRSAAGSSILEGALPETTVYDLGENVKSFQS
uniref:MBL fold metallo-hydrolase n=1 Tax=Roseihalotalea indica TaxID=2867963 RepID=A0AA49GNW6_9BACT|nr:MBL fold metallo-hydrolase [Tunicatimonas sp. TK19036]